MASTSDLIRTAVERFQAEVPSLQKLKLVFGLELRGRGDVQLYRVELPGPKISKDLAQDERILVQIDRPQFNELAEKGTLKSYRKAVETGHIKATGDSNVKKLIAQVVERHEERVADRLDLAAAEAVELDRVVDDRDLLGRPLEAPGQLAGHCLGHAGHSRGGPPAHVGGATGRPVHPQAGGSGGQRMERRGT